MNEHSNLSEIDYLNFFLHPAQEDDFLKNYRKLADFFPALVYVYDTDNKKIGFFNKKFSEFLGYSNEDFASFGDTWGNIIYKDDLEKFNDELKKFYALKDDENYSFDSRFNRKQGDWRYFRTLGTVLKRKDDGQPAAFLFVAQDVTDAINNSEELKKTKELFRETERLQRYGIYTYDIENDILTWSDGMYNLYEVEKKEENEKFNAAFSKNFITPEDVEQVTADYENAIQNGVDYDNEFSIITKKQNNRILLNRAKLIKNENETPVKIIGSLRDITKEKLFERELQKTIKDLDR
jgi:PAS domain S-box-containing protein